jgi:site-specific DNA-methyltransferase (cytosine-N4-specific)
VLRTLPSESVDCVVTSPPYFGLRDYGVAGQLGVESSPAEYVSALVGVFTEVHRVLSSTGTLWLNLGDSYATATCGGTQGRSGQRASRRFTAEGLAPCRDLPPKNLLGIPWRVAFALQDAGWILRNDIIWAKPNGMPESVGDRLSTRHEHVFLLAKSRHYYFNLDAIKVKSTGEAPGNRPDTVTQRSSDLGGDGHRAGRRAGGNPGSTLAEVHQTRNPGDVWTIPTQPFPEAHFAASPIEIPRKAIAAGCKPAGVVLDPFSGSGTTGLAAAELACRYIGIDLNRDYLDMRPAHTPFPAHPHQ